MLAQEKEEKLKLKVFVSDTIEIIKKYNPGFRRQTIQDELGRYSASVETDIKKVKAAVSLYAFV